MSLTSVLQSQGVKLPVLTASKSGSAMIDATIAANNTPPPAAVKQPLPVDSVGTVPVDGWGNQLVNGSSPGQWILLTAQPERDRNGVYRNPNIGVDGRYNGGTLPWEFVDLRSERITPDWVHIWHWDNNAGKWVKEWEESATIQPEQQTVINMPAPALSTSVPVLTMLTEPTIKNTGIMPPTIDPSYGTMLPEVDIVADKTATGLNIKPIYLIGGVIALVAAYFIWKKYGK